MSLTTTAAAVTAQRQASTGSTTSLRGTTVIAGLVTAAATTGAAAVHAAGVSFEAGGKMIPLADFAELSLLGALIGGVLVPVLNRRSRSARRPFLQTAVALPALSWIRSIAWATTPPPRLRS